MNNLSHLIVKSDWSAVWRTLKSSPQQLSIPVSTNSKETVYPLHQAVCITTKPVSESILDMMIRSYPKALDHNVFLGACQNPHFSRDSMEMLLDSASPQLSQIIHNHVYQFTSIAVKRRNVDIVDLFINRYPEILLQSSGNILIHACLYGTGEIVEMIIKAGYDNKIGQGGGLFHKNQDGEDALDVAIRSFEHSENEKKQITESYNILIMCLQYANAARMGKKEPAPNYPIILSAIEWCPKLVLGKIIKRNEHEIANKDQVGKWAILKTIQFILSPLEGEKFSNKRLPDIFHSQILIDACTSGTPDIVQKILQKQSYLQQCGEEKPEEGVEEGILKQKLEKENNKNNAFEISIKLYDENDNDRCEILRSCVQYFNASRLGIRFPLPSSDNVYPTLLAASGLVPHQILTSLGRKYKHEINMRKINRTGKMAIEKVLQLSKEMGQFAKRLDRRLQFPLHVKKTLSSELMRLDLNSIPELLEV